MSDTPRLYVGTYAKYNDGNLFGKWIDLEDFDCKEDFLEACAELHKDEDDPELMFQDFEGFPREMYSESSVSDELWDNWVLLNDSQREILQAYLEDVDSSGTIEQAEEAYQGQHKSELDFAYELVEDLGYMNDMSEHLRMYFDYEKFAQDLFISDYIFATDGHVFRR